MSTSKKLKILVCGDVEGNFKTLFSRVNIINEKNGPFDFLFCVGDFFSESLSKLEPYKNGVLTVSVPTYILGPNRDKHVAFYEDMSGCEICPNVSFLGKHGILTSNGLKIAYISGRESERNKTNTTLTENDAIAVHDAALRNRGNGQYKGVDILLSSEWPKGVTRFDKNAEEDDTGSQVLAWLACQLKPRYHFSGLRNVFYERPPYKNCNEDGSSGKMHCTRFIGLARVGNVEKRKWLYAVSLTPLSEIKDNDLYQSTTDQTECPYFNPKKNNMNIINTQYFFDTNVEYDQPKKRRRHTSSENNRKFDDTESCWFCLASRAVEKHLVVSIGEEVYLALAKGGLTPFHVMIVPIKHHRCQTELTKNAKNEVKKYKSALKKFFKSKDLVPVMFERNYKTSHLQLHIIPVPKHLIVHLKEIFLRVSEEDGVTLSELPHKAHLKDFAQPGAPYFYLELPTGEKLLTSCQKNFPINFGRYVLAGKEILNLPDRINWRDCVKNKEEEEKMAKDFRIAFESFDDVS